MKLAGEPLAFALDLAEGAGAGDTAEVPRASGKISLDQLESKIIAEKVPLQIGKLDRIGPRGESGGVDGLSANQHPIPAGEQSKEPQRSSRARRTHGFGTGCQGVDQIVRRP
jgi:hypothetical protein